MALPPPSAKQQPKKEGLGCLGCGCAILLALLLLVLGMVGLFGYLGVREIIGLTSTTPLAVPAPAVSDDIYNGALKKVDAFNQAVGTGNAASLSLDADEINALIAHNPDIDRMQGRFVVTLNGDEAHLEGTVPTDRLAFLRVIAKGRNVNIDATFSLTFNSDTKLAGVDLHKLTLGDTLFPTEKLPSLQAFINPLVNNVVKSNRPAANALLVAKTVSIRDSHFVIETK